ncbi:pyridoxal-phosphate-dependent aminotransferase family protein [Halomarina ordinaria]|uniref:Pyridoxal-phosphate-dependent aminotransferase family protein n=1 Tax=Halomarina ordinaria TaxID=3033939 RepID=A0ABD5UAX1_9EURY|nr:alanine--glyoxylate aminotransferase family protein [Halomarina sp. PSRA2]
MSEEFLLLNPGPVPLSDRVRRAMDEPMVSHRSAEFEATYERAQDGLEYVFTQSTPDERTTGEGTALVLNGTATMGMEMAVANLTDADSEVVTLVNGKFGRRFKRIAERHAQVRPVEVDWGESFDLDAVEAAVGDETAVVTMVHNETSTGLLNPVAEVGELARAHDALFVVDGVTSIGGDEFRIDDWHVDLAITDSQKALAAPPGVSAVFVTERAAERADGESAPFYEDLDWHLRKADQHQTPFTSAVPLFRALAEAVGEIESEGMPGRIERHRRQSRAFRTGFEALGLDPFPTLSGPTEYSNTLTAMSLPADLRGDDAGRFFDAVAERNVSISGGQAHLGGDIFRVSNMGHLSSAQVLRGVRTVGEALNDAGVAADVEVAVSDARDVLD